MSDDILADLPVDAEISATEVAFAGRVWDIRRDTFTTAGFTMTREYMDHSGAVAVLAIDDEERVLLIQQYRHPIRRRDWEIPAGLLDVPGEDPLVAAQRELAEEADLVASDWSAAMPIFTSPGGSDEVVHIFVARGLSASTAVYERVDEEAEIVTRWVTLDEVVAAVLDGRLRNAILMVAVLAADARRRR